MLTGSFKNHFALLEGLLIFIPFNALYLVIVSPLIRLVGFNWATKEQNYISATIFGCLVFNCLIVPIILQANFKSDYPESFMDQAFSQGGRNSDMSSNWYRDIGP